MEKPAQVDYVWVAREVKLAIGVVENTVRLLDEGNTIPFITRFRKDLTGGLNEKQILEIKRAIVQQRALAERKAYILKSIESQGGLTEELKTQIANVGNGRALEDLYLPFKPQKQSRAVVAKQQGLEPLVEEILNASSADVDLASRATHFVRVDKGLNSVDDVIRGVSDLLVERFSANSDLKNELRKIVRKTGMLVAKGADEPADQPNVVTDKTKSASPETHPSPLTMETSSQPAAGVVEPSLCADIASTVTQTESDPLAAEVASLAQTEILAQTGISAPTEIVAETEPSAPTEIVAETGISAPIEISAPTEIVTQTATDSEGAAELSTGSPECTQSVSQVNDSSVDSSPHSLPATSPEVVTSAEITQPAAAESGETRKAKRKKKKKAAPDPFKDYRDFKQPLKNLNHHQYLALNRGERADSLKIKVQADEEQTVLAAIHALVPAEHPFSEFLKKCATEALNRTLLPSIEREIRRELTEAAEKHATEVFANNLRSLLLQPPLRNGRVLAIDPGFKSGCGVAVLDNCGNVLEHGHIYVVGNQSKRDESSTKIADWVNRWAIDVIAIGTGAACRQAEQLISDVIATTLSESKVRYVMVNEAGASVYSVSEIGREELPDLSPAIRSAVSIGRRLQDPLSEFVKISPPNIGVGMYQHDVKAKHLIESLEEIVELCVNQVGVNVNTASVSLLKYVSGLNALAARRLVEHRQKIGGFKNRQQLKEVSGVGDATFIQSAGFLRIHDGDNPLDSTSIHSESYPLAEIIIALAKTTIEELFPILEASPTTNTPAPEIPPAGVADESEPNETGSVAISATEPSDANTNAAHPLAVPTTPAAESLGDANPGYSSESPDVELEANVVATEVSPTEHLPSGEAPIAPANADLPDLTVPVPVAKQAEEAERRAELSPEIKQKLELRKQALDRLAELNINAIADEHLAGRMLVRDVLLALKKPSYDPRDRISKPIFRRGILKIDDLKPEMQLEGQVVNVVDFGVFIDIGLGESSLVHVSQLSHRYVADPHRFYAVGDVMRVWVAEVDAPRRRVKLTAIQPGSKPPVAREGGRRRGGERTATNDGNRRREGRESRKPVAAGEGKSFQSKPASSESRVQRFENQKSKQRYEQRRDKGTDSRQRHQTRPPKPKQPAPPITDGMLKGSEPMRSFSDLLQFVQKKPTSADE